MAYIIVLKSTNFDKDQLNRFKIFSKNPLGDHCASLSLSPNRVKPEVFATHDRRLELIMTDNFTEYKT